MGLGVLLARRDKIYAYDSRERIQSMSIEELLSAPANPWQRAYVERVIGSIRRDCLDHAVIFPTTDRVLANHTLA